MEIGSLGIYADAAGIISRKNNKGGSSIDEHSQVVDALAAGDAARAIATMRSHLDALLARLDLQGSLRREANLADLLGVRPA